MSLVPYLAAAWQQSKVPTDHIMHLSLLFLESPLPRKNSFEISVAPEILLDIGGSVLLRVRVGKHLWFGALTRKFNEDIFNAATRVTRLSYTRPDKV